MTDDEVNLWRFVIENFRTIPRLLKQSITAVEWQKIIIVHKRELLGVDRRDMGLAIASRQICASQGQDVALENFLPVKLWENPELTPDDLDAKLDGMTL